MSTQDVIFEAINVMEELGWSPTSNVSEATKQSVAVTKAWQARLTKGRKKQFRAEVRIAPGLNEKLDMVDAINGIAYELKLSSKNPKHEFFKDLFKVIVYNRHHRSKLKTFAFITEELGAKSLQKGLGREASQIVGKFGISVEFPHFICH